MRLPAISHKILYCIHTPHQNNPEISLQHQTSPFLTVETTFHNRLARINKGPNTILHKIPLTASIFTRINIEDPAARLQRHQNPPKNISENIASPMIPGASPRDSWIRREFVRPSDDSYPNSYPLQFCNPLSGRGFSVDRLFPESFLSIAFFPSLFCRSPFSRVFS
jgi:hypothetical protein